MACTESTPCTSEIQVWFVRSSRTVYLFALVLGMRASSPSHQVLGSKPSLCRISAEVRLCFGYSFPLTPLVWEPLALGLPLRNESDEVWSKVSNALSMKSPILPKQSTCSITNFRDDHHREESPHTVMHMDREFQYSTHGLLGLVFFFSQSHLIRDRPKASNRSQEHSITQEHTRAQVVWLLE
jgi:hypothetical protein